MRFPVFARRANPSVEKPILHKSKTYVFEQVASGRADWVDPSQPKRGIIARETLYFGPRELRIVEDTGSSAGLGFGALKFVDPNPKRDRITLAFLWAHSERGYNAVIQEQLWGQPA
jgi:hypothetical protein